MNSDRKPKLSPPRGFDTKVNYEIKRARKPYRCDDYPASHYLVIKPGDLYLLVTEYPGGESGYASSAGRPVRMRMCLDDAPLWVKEQIVGRGLVDE